MMELVLENPAWLYAWALASFFLVLLHFYRKRIRVKSAIKFTGVFALEKLKVGKEIKGEIYLVLLTIISLFFVCLAGGGLAKVTHVSVEKLNLVLAIDKSSSMLFEDYKPNRLEAVKNALIPFIDKIPENVRVAVVAYGSYVELVQNFTTNKDELKRSIKSIQPATVAGTAIGDALFFSSQLLPVGEPNVIILLTDGRSNVGILVEKAVEVLIENKIVTHTVGLGSLIEKLSEVDENTLKFIAAKTGGIYSFSKTSVELEDIYKKMGEMIARPKIVVEKHYFTPLLLLIGIGLMILEIVLASTVFQIIS
jgi:Ca-activated chloride channel family protein